MPPKKQEEARSANNGELHLLSRVKERQQRRTALVVKGQGAPTTANCTCCQGSRSANEGELHLLSRVKER
ncbi:hypothetical protein N7465_003974 [Penicillium sp. CMV-2018d]|nr:hypothetical protein N7465_003974 [Penicillium sp. CMV-2018d]